MKYTKHPYAPGDSFLPRSPNLLPGHINQDLEDEIALLVLDLGGGFESGGDAGQALEALGDELADVGEAGRGAGR